MFRFTIAVVALAAGLVASAGPAPAEPLPYGSIGLYVSEDRSVNTVSYSGGLTEFTMYIYCLPGPHGMAGAEFAVSYPSNVIPAEVTTNPLVSVSLGDVDAGVSVAFYDCQSDLVWTHKQRLFLVNADESRIEIEKNQTAGAYQLSTCEVGNPLEPALLASSVGLNAPCPPDATPPLFQAAAAISSNGVQLTFSEPLLKLTAEDLLNYEVADFDTPTVTLSVGEAKLRSDDRSVELYTWETFALNHTYVVRVHGVYDLWGNVIQPPYEQTFFPIDHEPPILVSALPAGDSLLTVVFNEPMATASAGIPANYSLKYPDGSTCACHAYAVTFITRKSVLLHYRAPLLPSLRELVLTVRNVTDLAGNVISPTHNTIHFTVPDTAPPVLDSVVPTGSRALTVRFDEAVTAPSATDAGNYEVFKTADTLSTLPVIAAGDLTSGKIVSLTLGGDLLLGTSYTLRVRNITDLRGNRMPAPRTMAFVLNDTAPPVPLSALPLTRTLIEISFNESLDQVSAETSTNYRVYETADQAQTRYVSTAELQPSRTAVRLTLGSLLSLGVSYTIRITGVKDVPGNAISGATITVMYPDSVPPVFTGVTPISARLIELAFDEKLSAAPAETESNYLLFETGHPSNVLAISLATLTGDGSRVQLTPSTDLVSGRSCTISVSNLTDLKGNLIAPGSSRVFTYTDTTPPRLLSAHSDDYTIVLAQFSEKLYTMTAEAAGNYRVFKTADQSVTIPVTSVVLTGDSSGVRLSLGGTVPPDVPYSLQATGVTDRASNPVPTGSVVPITVPDTTPPHLAAVAALTLQCVRVTFDEPVAAATARVAANYLLVPTDPGASIVPTVTEMPNDTTVDLGFAGILASGATYALYVSNVRDLAGNVIALGSRMSFVCPSTPPATGYIGLYADANHSISTVTYGGGFFTPFRMYVWYRPGSSGLIAAEFHIVYPGNVLASDITMNPLVAVSLGDITTDLSVAFSQCNTGWTWILVQDCYLLNPDVSAIQVGSGPIFANCSLGYPIEAATIMNRLSCNSGGGSIGTLLQESSASCEDGAVRVAWRLSKMDESARFSISRAEYGTVVYGALSGVIVRNALSFSYRDEDVAPGKTYRYRVEYTDADGAHVLFESEPVAVPALPLTLNQNWPNPFNPLTTISYYLPAPAQVRLEIFDVAGHRIACLVNAHKESGNHSVAWNGTDASGKPMAAGIYICRLSADRGTLARKMVLVR